MWEEPARTEASGNGIATGSKGATEGEDPDGLRNPSNRVDKETWKLVVERVIPLTYYHLSLQCVLNSCCAFGRAAGFLERQLLKSLRARDLLQLSESPPVGNCHG
jgi:hypothetical protein